MLRGFCEGIGNYLIFAHTHLFFIDLEGTPLLIFKIKGDSDEKQVRKKKQVSALNFSTPTTQTVVHNTEHNNHFMILSSCCLFIVVS